MTIISTYRAHTYKATSSRRDISPKKVPITIATYKRPDTSKATKTTKETNLFLALLMTMQPNYIQPMPKPSAPSVTMSTRTIYVWGEEYTVEIPEEFDIYEGLRLWYPNLYKEAINENEYINSENTVDDDDGEEAWAKYDLQEWLYDF